MMRLAVIPVVGHLGTVPSLFQESATNAPVHSAHRAFPASTAGGQHHHETKKIDAVDDAAAIQQATVIANELSSSHGAKIIVMVVGPSSGKPIETIERG